MSTQGKSFAGRDFFNYRKVIRVGRSDQFKKENLVARSVIFKFIQYQPLWCWALIYQHQKLHMIICFLTHLTKFIAESISGRTYYQHEKLIPLNCFDNFVIQQPKIHRFKHFSPLLITNIFTRLGFWNILKLCLVWISNHKAFEHTRQIFCRERFF